MPFVLGIPVVTFFNSLRERRFASHWADRLGATGTRFPPPADFSWNRLSPDLPQDHLLP
jgi:hypothetical protein